MISCHIKNAYYLFIILISNNGPKQYWLIAVANFGVCVCVKLTDWFVILRIGIAIKCLECIHIYRLLIPRISRSITNEYNINPQTKHNTDKDGRKNKI